jgi:hypothetical protein
MFPIVRTNAKECLGHVAVMTKDLEARRKAVAQKPQANLGTSANLPSVRVAAAVDVIYSQKRIPGFATTSTFSAVVI